MTYILAQVDPSVGNSAALTAFDIISLIASIASLILAILAIWLSFVFYRMSDKASRETTEAAKDIAAAVERLEKLFDKLYSDTFSMMRDTVSDMRKHIWPTDEAESEKTIEEVEKKADEKIIELKKGLERQVEEILQRQRIADDKVTTVTSEMRQLVDRAINGSRRLESEAREETAREHIIRALRVMRHRRRVSVMDLVERIGGPFPIPRIISELERLKTEGIISMTDGPIEPTTQVYYPPSRIKETE